MAITILQRPRGYVLESTPLSGGDASEYSVNNWVLINVGVLHNLVNGDVVYISSDIGNYNGFWIVEVTTTTTFLIYNEEGSSDRELYIASTTNLDVYKTTYEHGWSCVHLPITYKLSNNLYPTNSADSSANINSVQDANGFTVLQLSGSPGTVHSYDFLKLTVPNDTDLSGVYQIVEFISPTVMIINMQYDATNNFTGATAVRQYNNYTVLINVYAGLNSGHTWASQKPYELAATKEYTPDENNEIFFSISDILQSYIETRNNLVLGTLPNNIDFFTQFYIEIAEKYDDSDGYVFGSFTDSFTSDQSNFEGVAVNSKLEFKNIYSGYLSEYLMVNNSGKFLTHFDITVIFQCGDNTPDCYQDISWLKIDSLPVTLRKEFYVNGDGPVIIDEDIDEDLGVIRSEIETDCDYDRIDLTLLVKNTVNSYNIIRNTSGQTSQDFDFFIPAGTTPPGTYSYSISMISGITGGDIISVQLYFVFWDGTTELITSALRTTVGTTSVSSIAFPVPSKSVIAIRLVGNIFDNAPTTLNASVLAQFNITDDETIISETKQFRIECGCVNREIRLTWLNNLGGFEYWAFTAKADHIREIQEAIETKKNILPNWPKSYGADADTIRKQTKRVSNKAYTIRSQFLTENEADALSYIKSSLLVQIINSRNDRRTVIVDSDSFIVRKDGDKTFEIAFNVSFTDDIPVQSL